MIQQSSRQQQQYDEAQPIPRLNGLSILFLIGLPIITVPWVIYDLHRNGLSSANLWLCLTLVCISGITITAGYHRYFSHRTYDCAPIIQWLYLFFGAMTAEQSALVWSSDHRYHHQFQDQAGDPYNVKRGFWWAHMGWMLFRNPENRPFANVPDLKKNPRVMWQYRHYAPLMLAMNFGLPTLIGLAYDNPLGGFLWGGLLRMFLFHQCTFLINSAAHTFGQPTHSRANTAKDNYFLAFFTFGEGHHSFHHAYPSDHRIGWRWYHWDPGKWWIRGLARVGLASHLKMIQEFRTAERPVSALNLVAGHDFQNRKSVKF